jgi:hypothetical protein
MDFGNSSDWVAFRSPLKCQYFCIEVGIAIEDQIAGIRVAGEAVLNDRRRRADNQREREYAPNEETHVLLNPVELLQAGLSQLVTAAVPSESSAQLAGTTSKDLRSIQKLPAKGELFPSPGSEVYRLKRFRFYCRLALKGHGFSRAEKANITNGL